VREYIRARASRALGVGDSSQKVRNGRRWGADILGHVAQGLVRSVLMAERTRGSSLSERLIGAGFHGSRMGPHLVAKEAVTS
jgi:hypothetical protein